MSGKIILNGRTFSLKSTNIRAKTDTISKATFRMGGFDMEIETTQEVMDPPCVIFGGADGHVPSRIRIEIHVEDDPSINLPPRPSMERPESHMTTEGATPAEKREK